MGDSDLSGPDASTTFDAGSPVPPPFDASPPQDAGVVVTMDAGMSMLDAGFLGVDAGNPSVDGGNPGVDAGNPMSWGPCMVGGTPGDCLHVDFCTDGRVTTVGLCPGNSEIRCCYEPSTTGPCDENVRVVGAANAGAVEPAGDPGCPAGMVSIAGQYCIDRYEAIVVEVLAGGSVVPHSPYFNPGTRRIRALSVPGVVPQSNISGTQAAQACAEAGKRLCTDDEWLRACRGASGFTYPYGNTRQNGVCNDAYSGHPAIDYFGTSADWIWSELDNVCINQQPNTVALSGARTGCVSSDGAFDMMGNLHEWTSNPGGVFRGGFYADTRINMEGCLYRTTAHTRGHNDYSTGFRCCADSL